MKSAEALMMVLSLKLSRKVIAKITERVGEGKCLCCDQKSVKRGLCQVHYDRWRRTRVKLPSKLAKARYDIKLMEAGELLGAYEIAEYRPKDNFQRAALEAS